MQYVLFEEVWFAVLVLLHLLPVDAHSLLVGGHLLGEQSEGHTDGVLLVCHHYAGQPVSSDECVGYERRLLVELNGLSAAGLSALNAGTGSELNVLSDGGASEVAEVDQVTGTGQPPRRAATRRHAVQTHVHQLHGTPTNDSSDEDRHAYTENASRWDGRNEVERQCRRLVERRIRTIDHTAEQTLLEQ